MSTAAYRYAQAMAVTEHARGRAEEERAWLDLLALLDAPAPAPSATREKVTHAVTFTPIDVDHEVFAAYFEGVTDEMVLRVRRNPDRAAEGGAP